MLLVNFKVQIGDSMMDVDKAAKHYKALIEGISEENVNRDGLLDTPTRAAKAFKFLTKGYAQSLDEVVNNAIFESSNDQMVVVRDVEVYSMCEHHLLPFIGVCHVGYLPTGKVIGLSKIARIIDMFARRLQIQEGLTQEIAEAIMKMTSATGVGVLIEAKHLCMMMRGVEKQNSSMKTSVMLGSFRSDVRTRAEFLNLVSV